MYERLIFATEIERAGTRQMLSAAFPLARIWDVYDDIDFILDMEAACTQETFFRYAIVTPGPARLLIYSCYGLSMEMHDPPLWMIHELRKLYLTSGELK
jgi:hypothetical protein